MDRRDFIKHLAAAGLGVSLFPTSSHAEVLRARAKYLIYIYMEGGMSHIDTFDPKTNDEVRGQYSPIDTVVPNLKLNQHFVNLSKHADKMAVIRSMSVKTGAHEQAQYIARTSYSKLGSIVHPAIGSWVSCLCPDQNGALPNAVTINAPASHPGSGWMSKKFAPLPIVDPAKGLQDAALKDLGQFNRRADILANMNKMSKTRLTPESYQYVEFYDETIKMLNSKELEIFDLSKEDAAIREKYGKDKFGQGLLLARRLIKLGKVNFVEVNYGGWDTHNDNFGQLDTKLPIVDNAVSALIEDLQQNGLLKDTLIVITTEFGRTPELNEKSKYGGRDHWPNAYSSALIGAGIKGGTVFGATDELGKEIISEPNTVEDFNATIATIMGIDVHQQLTSPEGRPFTVANKGNPIKAVLS